MINPIVVGVGSTATGMGTYAATKPRRFATREKLKKSAPKSAFFITVAFALRQLEAIKEVPCSRAIE